MTASNRVKITAADFNGTSWDGSPFESNPPWLWPAFQAGRITVSTVGHTDYASWDVRTPRGVVTAGPGDWITTDESGDLFVEKRAS